MKVLEAYILKRIATQAIGAVVASLAIVWTTQALTRINLVTDSGASASAFLFLATLLLPAMIPIVVPFAVLIASTQTLNGMNTDSELAVVHSAGTPRWTIYKPFLIAALIASALVIFFGNLVEPYARQRARVLVAEARANLISLVIQENTFKRIEDKLFMQVASREPNGALGGLLIADSRDPKQDMIYYAREGAIVQDEKTSLLLMQDGEIHSRTPENGALSIIRFKSYAFDLAAFTPTVSGVVYMPKDRFTSDLLNPDPNDKIFQSSPHRFVLEFNKRLSEWLYVPAFALLALVLSGNPRPNRGDTAMQTFFAVSVAFAVRWAGFIIEGKAEDIAWLWPMVHVPPIAVIGFCIWSLSTYSLVTSKFSLHLWQEKLMDRLAWISGKVLRLIVRRPKGTTS